MTIHLPLSLTPSKHNGLKNTNSERASPLPQLDRALIGLILGGAALCFFAIMGFGIKTFYFNGSPGVLASKKTEIPSIAVIPFQQFGPPNDDYLGEGVVEDILNYLAQIEGLRVISRTSTQRYKNTELSISDIGKELNSRFILEGSVRQNSDRIVINAALIDTQDERSIWAERFDQPRSNIMRIQRQVARSIAEALNETIGGQPENLVAQGPTENVDAYMALLQGRHLLRNRTKEDLNKSIDQFYLALQLDPKLAQAYEGLAEANFLLSDLRYEEDHAAYLAEAEKHARQAIDLDPQSGDAFAILGNLLLKQYRWNEAISAFENALDLQPNSPLINYWYSLTLRGVGYLDRALQYHKLAAELDPLHPVIQAGYIYTCNSAGAFELSDRLLEKAAPVMEGSFLYHWVKGNTSLKRGEYEAAITEIQQAIDLNPTFSPPYSDKYYCFGKLGQRDSVRQYLDRLDSSKAICQLRKAKLLLSIGETEQALIHFRRSAEMGLIPDDLLVNSIYDDIRGYQVYQDVLTEFGLSPFSTLNL